MRLDRFRNPDFRRGRPRWMEVLWICLAGLSFSTWVPGSGWRRMLLRAFGAQVGNGVVIKPRVRVKFPWKLRVGDHSWIGESVWIDNLDQVTIGSHCCISQGVHFCTGNHRWDRETFDLFTRPISIEDRCWVASGAVLAPGVIMRRGSVLGMGLQAFGEFQAETVYLSSGDRKPRLLLEGEAWNMDPDTLAG